MITNELIKSLNPCEDRFNNYLKHYSNKSHTKRQFMGLKNITYKDKVWVAFRLMSKDKIHLAAADIAESVLYLFEKHHPNDNRPRKAIKAARKGNKDAAAAADAAVAANAAAAYAVDTAYYAAYYAAYAAAYAAYATVYAVDAAYAAYTVYAVDTAYATAYAAYIAYTAAYADHDIINRNIQEKLIKTIILKYWRE